jgi:hypothetical protein
VRLHGCDSFYGYWSNATLIDYSGDSSSGFLAESLDRLDYLVAQLESHGIYWDLNLLVARRFLPGDSLDTPNPLPVDPITEGESWTVVEMDYNRHLGFIHDDVLEAQKQYATDLLTHVNPYTGLAYSEDPAVAIVEILNEAGIIHYWLWGRLDEMRAETYHELNRK